MSMRLLPVAALGAGLWLAMQPAELGEEVPLGIRNHNPGNLEANGIDWQGLAPEGDQEGRFYKFLSPLYGIRALARTLITYRTVHQLYTPAEIVSRWAPSFENKTAAYARHVARATGVGVNEPIPASQFPVLVKTIIKHENGIQPYPDSLIAEAIARAKA